VKLYEIDEQIASLIDEDGCITDEKKFNDLQMERSEKIENVGLYIKNLRADVDAYKNEIKAFQERKEQAEHKIESLENWLQGALDGARLKTDRIQISYRKSTRVEIADDAVIPEEFLKITTTPNKAEIKKYLKQGFKIDGVELQEHKNMSIK
jgi:predicted  nucleic acid-binding Zn-ribbon protein